MCSLRSVAAEPVGHFGGKHLSGFDRFRVRRRCGVRVQRSHRRTLSTKSDGARARTERDEWDAHAKYGAKLVSAVELLHSAALSGE